jgi:hypothetical protein
MLPAVVKAGQALGNRRTSIDEEVLKEGLKKGLTRL